MVRCTVAIVLLVLSFGSTAVAQTTAPKNAPAFSLADVVVAQSVKTNGSESLVLKVPVMEQRQSRRTVKTTVMDTQTQTYQVQVDGKTETRTRTVQVPRQVIRQIPYRYMAPNGMEKQSIAPERVTAWDLKGKQITKGELAIRLAKPTSVIRLQQPISTTQKVIDPYYASILRPDTLMLYVTPTPTSKPKSAKKK